MKTKMHTVDLEKLAIAIGGVYVEAKPDALKLFRHTRNQAIKDAGGDRSKVPSLLKKYLEDRSKKVTKGRNNLLQHKTELEKLGFKQRKVAGDFVYELKYATIVVETLEEKPSTFYVSTQRKIHRTVSGPGGTQSTDFSKILKRAKELIAFNRALEKSGIKSLPSMSPHAQSCGDKATYGKLLKALAKRGFKEVRSVVEDSGNVAYLKSFAPGITVRFELYLSKGKCYLQGKVMFSHYIKRMYGFIESSPLAAVAALDAWGEAAVKLQAELKKIKS